MFSVSQVAVAVSFSWLIFRNPISLMNAIGCSITLVGCTFYGYVRQLITQAGSPRTPRSPQNRADIIPLVKERSEAKVASY